MKIYQVGIHNKSCGDYSYLYNTLNKPRAEFVLKQLEEFRIKYPKFDTNFSEEEFKIFNECITELDRQLSEIIGKNIHQLSYMSERDCFVISSIDLDDNLPPEES